MERKRARDLFPQSLKVNEDEMKNSENVENGDILAGQRRLIMNRERNKAARSKC